MTMNALGQGVKPLKKPNATMAQQVARAASAFQQQRTGHTPAVVTVVLSGDTLVVTLHEALSPAEKALARSPAGAAQVQEFHRQLFSNSADSLRKEIKRITGVEVREAASEVETTTGTVVHAFTSGTMVQVFLLARNISAKAWNENSKQPQPRRPKDGGSGKRNSSIPRRTWVRAGKTRQVLERAKAAEPAPHVAEPAAAV